MPSKSCKNICIYPHVIRNIVTCICNLYRFALVPHLMSGVSVRFKIACMKRLNFIGLSSCMRVCKFPETNTDVL